MCQNTGSFSPSGSNFFSMMLQPSCPRRSGEFSTHLDINCEAALSAQSSEISVTAIHENRACAFILAPLFLVGNSGGLNKT
jgi:hypothetical protein